jgi:prepilin-type N-terminal cleavage/methylation domain-containing protein
MLYTKSTSSPAVPLLSRSLRTPRAFTLVELIIVLTILALLASVSFVAYQGYTTQSRDTIRLRDLSTIYENLLSTSAQNGKLPAPTGAVAIKNGSTTVAYQGYAGKATLDESHIERGGKDPVSGEYYTYLMNSARNKAQLLAFFEEAGYESKFAFAGVPEATAADYSTRYPATIGAPLGVILGPKDSTLNSQAPLQQIRSTDPTQVFPTDPSTLSGVTLTTLSSSGYTALLPTSASGASSTGAALTITGSVITQLVTNYTSGGNSTSSSSSVTVYR